MDVEKRKIYADYPILNDYIYLQTINLFLTVIYRKKYKQALKTYPASGTTMGEPGGHCPK